MTKRAVAFSGLTLLVGAVVTLVLPIKPERMLWCFWLWMSLAIINASFDWEDKP